MTGEEESFLPRRLGLITPPCIAEEEKESKSRRRERKKLLVLEGDGRSKEDPSGVVPYKRRGYMASACSESYMDRRCARSSILVLK